ncbi:hypothetical protein AVEN_100964-1, partial [Araneus ventricosus]
MTIFNQRTSIMKNALFAVNKEKRNWESNVLCASSDPMPPAWDKIQAIGDTIVTHFF